MILPKFWPPWTDDNILIFFILQPWDDLKILMLALFWGSDPNISSSVEPCLDYFPACTVQGSLLLQSDAVKQRAVSKGALLSTRAGSNLSRRRLSGRADWCHPLGVPMGHGHSRVSGPKISSVIQRLDLLQAGAKWSPQSLNLGGLRQTTHINLNVTDKNWWSEIQSSPQDFFYIGNWRCDVLNGGIHVSDLASIFDQLLQM